MSEPALPAEPSQPRRTAVAAAQSLCLCVDEMHPSLPELLEPLGVTLHFRPDLKAAEIPAALAAQPYDGLIVRSKLRITAELLAHGPHLRYVARAGAGVDNIDEAALAAARVTLLNAPEGNRDAVGEYALGLLLALFRNIVRADREVRQGIWQREANRGEEIAGKVVGILGYGHMGAAFAKRLSNFGCTVLAHDRNPAHLGNHNAILVSMQELQERADVLSIHIPYEAANKHFVNDELISGFYNPIWLLNTARGEVLDHAALVRGLQSGQVRGAALDVLENEKLATLTPVQQTNLDFLQTSPNVIFSPHIGGWSFQSYHRINEVLARKIGEFLKGGRAAH